MSISTAENKVKSCQREVERHRERQAREEARAAACDREAARLEEHASQTRSAGLAQSRLRSAQSKRSQALRAREAAAKESKAVAEAQKKLHEAQAGLAKEREREQKAMREKAKRAQASAERQRRSEERRRDERERTRTQDVAALHARAADLEAQLRAAPWARSPDVIDVLFIAASPEDEPPLRLDKEVREIQRSVRMSEHRESVRFHWQLATQVTDLLQALNEVRPHVVHFSGHGSQTCLVFEDTDGHAKPLSNSDLGTLLHVSSDRIHLALFNSCESSSQAALACEHINAAIGMDQPVDDQAAKLFAAQFYNAVAFGKSLADAFEQAKLQVKLAIGTASGSPTLHTAPGVDPGQIYLVKPEAA